MFSYSLLRLDLWFASSCASAPPPLVLLLCHYSFSLPQHACLVPSLTCTLLPISHLIFVSNQAPLFLAPLFHSLTAGFFLYLVPVLFPALAPCVLLVCKFLFYYFFIKMFTNYSLPLPATSIYNHDRRYVLLYHSRLS